MKLKSLHEIFENRFFRIPDYQRGFSWRERREITDFWDDLIYLNDRIHYTGLITLEPVQKNNLDKWEDDKWLIKKGYRSFYVVDGQQRLTTSVILIQSILETVLEKHKNTSLNYQSSEQIRNRFILNEAPNGQRKSYLLGYEKDDPSYEFLKTRIFGEYSHSNQNLQTLYTRNLENSKKFFKKKLEEMPVDKIERIFENLTQKLKFNLYEINDEIDVFVTFETMNNRGKPLTILELLKNRLIYLSTLFVDQSGREFLRKQINSAWKTIYEHLGKNPENPLSDNRFLQDHWKMYFQYSRSKPDAYINFLLKDKFTAQNVTHPSEKSEQLTIDYIDEYVTNLQQSIRPWFYIHNPQDRSFFDLGSDVETNRVHLERLNRLNFGAFRPLIMAAYVKKNSIDEINKMLAAMEKFIFVVFRISQRRSNTGDSKFFRLANELFVSERAGKISEIVDEINQLNEEYFNADRFRDHVSDKFRVSNSRGFYDWNGLHYFLYEYEQFLHKQSMNEIEKLSWNNLTKRKKNHVTIEHIYPQNERDKYWQNRYNSYDDQQKKYLTHSLGNLLPLSRAKNSSLQDRSFSSKKNNMRGIGYYNGSFSEIDVNRKTDWDAKDILERGISLLNFMESRWSIVIGDKDELLHLKFLRSDNQS